MRPPLPPTLPPPSPVVLCKPVMLAIDLCVHAPYMGGPACHEHIYECYTACHEHIYECYTACHEHMPVMAHCEWGVANGARARSLAAVRSTSQCAVHGCLVKRVEAPKGSGGFGSGLGLCTCVPGELNRVEARSERSGTHRLVALLTLNMGDVEGTIGILVIREGGGVSDREEDSAALGVQEPSADMLI